jgi:Ni/Fe-hydrogenase subunit HybB-like protein
MTRLSVKLTHWKAVAAIILAAGAYSIYVRFTQGLGAATNLSDQFPWGLWIGLDILCGVGLAGGGFTLAAIVYVFNMKRFYPILRPAILTAFLGYVLVIVALLFDLGRPWQIWHAIIMWNPHSVMFEVAWCVMLYTTVLALEFSPVVLERFHMTRTLKLIKSFTIPLVIVGVLLSTLHQSSLGSLYLIVPEKLYPLWYSPFLPVFFFISAVAAGCGMVILESFLSSRAFKRGLELRLLSELSRVAVVVLAVYLVLRILDGYQRHIAGLLFVPRVETYLYWLEIVVGVLLPLILFSFPRVRRNPDGLYLGAVSMVIGFVLGRLNVSVTGMEASSGTAYVPSLMEASITLSIITAGFIAFAFAAKHLPVFDHEEPEAEAAPESWEAELELVSQPVRR